MLFELIKALVAPMILVLFGGALYQLCYPRKRISLLEALSFGWGLGLVLLYLLGLGLAQLKIPLVYLTTIIVPITGLTLLVAFLKTRGCNRTQTVATNWNLLTVGIFVLICMKLLLILSLSLSNPIVDSDAADQGRWMGRAKTISMQEFVVASTPSSEKLSPSLIPIWSALFLSRWHDSLVAIPWWFTLIAFLSIICDTAFRMTNDWTYSLGLSGLFLTLPLLSVHVIRPGWSDLIVAYLLAASLSIFIRQFLLRDESRFNYLLITLFSIGLFLTKQESIAWAAWIVVITMSFLVVHQNRVSWKTLIVGQLIGLAFLYLLYFALSGYVLEHFELDGKTASIFEKRMEVAVIKAFFTSLLFRGGFNLLWWFYLIASVYLMFWSKVPEHRVLTFYSLGLFMGLFYLCCFTANAEFTILGTNQGRFLLQLSSLALPSFILVYKETG